jgi:hypothetical protein
MDEDTTPTPYSRDDGRELDGARDPVAAALATLDGLDDRPVTEHVVVFERVHESLRRALAGDGARG